MYNWKTDLDRGSIRVRPTAILLVTTPICVGHPLTLNCDLDIQYQATYGRDPHTHRTQFNGNSVQKVKDRRTDRRTLPIALPFRLTRSVTNVAYN